MEPIDQKLQWLEQQVELRKQQIAAIDEEAKKFIELRLQGLRTPEIAQACDVTPAHVTNSILAYEKRYRLPPSHNATRAAVADERAEKMRSLKLQGVLLQEIAQMYGISVGSVSQAIAGYEKRQELSNSRVSRSKRAVQPNRDKPIVTETADARGEKFRSLKLQGLTLEEIGGTYGITRERVRQLIARYEKKYGLSPSIPTSRQMRTSARKADIKEYRKERRHEQRVQRRHFAEVIQLDACLVGTFLRDLGDRTPSYRYFGRYNRRNDGTPHPSSEKPTQVCFYPGGATRDSNTQSVHHWVLEQYGIDVPRGYHCHHIDGDVTNNMFENLQVLSNVEHGRITRSSYAPRKLTDEQVEEMRRLYREKEYSAPQIAKMYGTSVATAYNALYGRKVYSSINPASRCAPIENNRLTNEQVEEIRANYQPRVISISALAEKYGIGHSTIERVLYGEGGYKDVNPSYRYIPISLEKPLKEKKPRVRKPAKEKKPRDYTYDTKPRKLTNEQVEEARALYRTGLTLTTLAEKYGVGHSTIENAIYGKRGYEDINPSTRYVKDETRKRSRESSDSTKSRNSTKPRKLTDEQVEEIRTLYHPGKTTFRILATRYNVSHFAIECALYGTHAYSNVNPSTRYMGGNLEVKQIPLDFGV